MVKRTLNLAEPVAAISNMDMPPASLKRSHLSLFSGIGGLDLAAEAAGFQTVGQCEWADYPTKILERHWPDVPRWRDIRTLTKESFYARTGLRTVDIVSGGVPCQPFSVAGKRRGKDDYRYLWPEMLRIVEELKPTWVIGENVAGIIDMALDTVLADLESQGYEARAIVLPACGVNAPHKRYRCAIVAHTHGKGLQGGQQCGETDPSGKAVPYSYNRGGPLRRDGKLSTTQGAGSGWRDLSGGTPELCGGEWRAAESGMGGSYDGLPYWMDRVKARWADGSWEFGIPRITCKIPDRANRLKCLGNAVVPAQFYPIFQVIHDQM